MNQIRIKPLFHGHNVMSYGIFNDSVRIYETFWFEIGDTDSFKDASCNLRNFIQNQGLQINNPRALDYSRMLDLPEDWEIHD